MLFCQIKTGGFPRKTDQFTAEKAEAGGSWSMSELNQLIQPTSQVCRLPKEQLRQRFCLQLEFDLATVQAKFDAVLRSAY